MCYGVCVGFRPYGLFPQLLCVLVFVCIHVFSLPHFHITSFLCIVTIVVVVVVLVIIVIVVIIGGGGGGGVVVVVIVALILCVSTCEQASGVLWFILLH
jgi:hypothetical protein